MKTVKNHKRLGRRKALYTPYSSTTVLINYSEESRKLEVEFVGGRVYHYLAVEPEVWEEYRAWVVAGQSSGTFVNKIIKPNYTHLVIEE